MERIKNFPLEDHPTLKKCIQYFLFSYYSRGMNFTDMAQLRWTDIYNDRIKYTRSKTSGNFNIKVSPPLQEILDYFKSEYAYTGFVFPVLSDFHQSESQIKYRIRKCLKQHNGQLKEVAAILKINIALTSYVARHTYATTLKRKGIDTAVISEGLGHQDVSTTKAYLQQFETETIDKADEVL
jgi:site-specific recombinase XerD